MAIEPYSPDAPLLAASDLTALAVGAAHDVRNLLFVVSTHSHRLLQALDADDPLRADAAAIRDAAERAARLARQVLSAGRFGGTPRETDVNSVIRGCESLLQKLCGTHVALHVELADGVWPVPVTATQLEQVLINLAVNACDAMPDGGVLRIATHATRERRVVVSVADSGKGMDAVVQSRMFEPFFTTRAESGGSGVGLATVNAIVAQAGGTIDVQSAPGQGTHVRVSLPARAAHEPRVVQRARRSARILVVEDEAAVRQLLAQCLNAQGYEPVVAGTAGEAAEAWDTAPEPFDLVVSDISLPDAEGPQLAARFRREREQVELLFMSGSIDAPEVITRAGLRAPILTKPFSMAEFADAIRLALHQAPAA
ncbi:MAG: ATP-binding protein [Vicinamibacterales bacterium]